MFQVVHGRKMQMVFQAKVFQWCHGSSNSYESLEDSQHSRWYATAWNKYIIRQVQEAVCPDHHHMAETVAKF